MAGDTEATETGPFSAEIPQKLVAFVDGKWMTCIMAVLTIFVLWGDDLRISAFSKPHDVYFFIIFVAALILFLGEFFINTIAKAGYKWSFFFWLDLIAGASVAPDIPWIIEFFGKVTSGETESSGGPSVSSSVESARTARVVRLVRLIRLIRIVKLYSMMRKASTADSQAKERAQALSAQNAKQAALKRVEASGLGKVLSEMTTRRTVMMVLLMLFVNPQLQFRDVDTSKQFGLSQLFWYGRGNCTRETLFGCEHQNELWMDPEGWSNLIYLYSRVQREHTERTAPADMDTLLWLYVPNLLNRNTLEGIPRAESDFGVWEEHTLCGGFQPDVTCEYRDNDMMMISYQPFECLAPSTGCAKVTVFARFQMAKRMVIEANFRMIMTFVVCILLGSMSVQFQNDTQSLVIGPMEKMVNIIKQLAEDPLRKPDSIAGGTMAAPTDDAPQLETTMLENTIAKIGHLLQIGFGEDGAAIIGRNMSSGDGELNIMMPGKKSIAIFGYMEVRRFSDLTKCLSEDVMIFINTIGCILHQCVSRWSGSSNKSFGDGFLVHWKLPYEDDDRDKNDIARISADTASKALFAFVKFIMECRRSTNLCRFQENKSIIETFGPNFFPDIVMGLHVGWAIEGPIGSDFKVDANYISPHINLTLELVERSRTYNTPLLLSEKFYNMLPLHTKEQVRKIDVVMIGDSPQGIYAYPVVDPRNYVAPEDHIIGDIIMGEGYSIDPLLMEEDAGVFIFIIDEDCKGVYEGVVLEEFFEPFRRALVHYVDGEWKEAKEALEQVIEMVPKDGPSLAMLSYMESDKFEPPSDWAGCRPNNEFFFSGNNYSNSTSDVVGPRKSLNT